VVVTASGAGMGGQGGPAVAFEKSRSDTGAAAARTFAEDEAAGVGADVQVRHQTVEQTHQLSAARLQLGGRAYAHTTQTIMYPSTPARCRVRCHAPVGMPHGGTLGRPERPPDAGRRERGAQDKARTCGALGEGEGTEKRCAPRLRKHIGVDDGERARGIGAPHQPCSQGCSRCSTLGRWPHLLHTLVSGVLSHACGRGPRALLSRAAVPSSLSLTHTHTHTHTQTHSACVRLGWLVSAYCPRLAPRPMWRPCR
jgi:hypothetical protein